MHSQPNQLQNNASPSPTSSPSLDSRSPPLSPADPPILPRRNNSFSSSSQFQLNGTLSPNSQPSPLPRKSSTRFPHPASVRVWVMKPDDWHSCGVGSLAICVELNPESGQIEEFIKVSRHAQATSRQQHQQGGSRSELALKLSSGRPCILFSKLDIHNNYQLDQKDYIIAWYDPVISESVAIAFHSHTECNNYWKFIGQRTGRVDFGPPQPEELIVPNSSNLTQVISQVSNCPKVVGSWLIEQHSDYLPALYKVYQSLRNEHDPPPEQEDRKKYVAQKLTLVHTCGQIINKLLRYADRRVTRKLFSDSFFHKFIELVSCCKLSPDEPYKDVESIEDPNPQIISLQEIADSAQRTKTECDRLFKPLSVLTLGDYLQSQIRLVLRLDYFRRTFLNKEQHETLCQHLDTVFAQQLCQFLKEMIHQNVFREIDQAPIENNNHLNELGVFIEELLGLARQVKSEMRYKVVSTIYQEGVFDKLVYLLKVHLNDMEANSKIRYLERLFEIAQMDLALFRQHIFKSRANGIHLNDVLIDLFLQEQSAYEVSDRTLSPCQYADIRACIKMFLTCVACNPQRQGNVTDNMHEPFIKGAIQRLSESGVNRLHRVLKDMLEIVVNTLQNTSSNHLLITLIDYDFAQWVCPLKSKYCQILNIRLFKNLVQREHKQTNSYLATRTEMMKVVTDAHARYNRWPNQRGCNILSSLAWSCLSMLKERKVAEFEEAALVALMPPSVSSSMNSIIEQEVREEGEVVTPNQTIEKSQQHLEIPSFKRLNELQEQDPISQKIKEQQKQRLEQQQHQQPFDRRDSLLSYDEVSPRQFHEQQHPQHQNQDRQMNISMSDAEDAEWQEQKNNIRNFSQYVGTADTFKEKYHQQHDGGGYMYLEHDKHNNFYQEEFQDQSQDYRDFTEEDNRYDGSFYQDRYDDASDFP